MSKIFRRRNRGRSAIGYIANEEMPVSLRMKKMEYMLNVLNSPAAGANNDQAENFLIMVPENILKPYAEKYTRKASDLCLEIKHHEKDYRSGEENVREYLNRLQRYDALRKSIFKDLRKIFEKLYSEFEPEQAESCPFYRKIQELEKNFGLTEAETELLILVYLRFLDGTIHSIVDQIMGSLQIQFSTNTFYLNTAPVIALMTGLSKSEVLKASGKDSSLIKLKLVEADDPAPEVISFLNGQNETPLSDCYFKETKGEALPLENHIIEKKHLQILTTLMSAPARKGGVNILLYGEPGTGKTELAKSLCKSLNIKLHEVCHITDERNDNDYRFRALIACQRMTKPEDSAILIDEADGMLNTQCGFFMTEDPKKKGLLNAILDQSDARRIWITNHSSRIDASTMRRFDFSLEFSRPCHTQRLSIWKTSLEKHGLAGLFGPEDVERLAGLYEVNAGGIEIVIRNLKNNMDKKEALNRVDGLLRAHIKVMDGREPGNPAEANSKNYSLEGLNIRGGHEEAVATLKSFSEYWHNTPLGEGSIRNMNVLLFGPPGAGKTEFAKYLARTLERRIIQKRGSDLLSMWVGESEKQIRRAFEEAEREKSILFIDEADGLFGSREKAVRSWEMSQANELLTAMERMKGMLVCSTNFRNGLDPASIRRFNIKLEFDYLKPEGNMSFYTRVLGDLSSAKMTDAEMADLGSVVHLTPGDFKVVWQQYAFRKPEEVAHRALIDALKEEIRNKEWLPQKRMGF